MWRRFAVHLLNMFAILLWVASALSFASDQAALGWAVILVILINAVFAFVQEYRAEKAIEALKNMLPPKAKVIRDGQLQEIEARMLVPAIAYMERKQAEGMSYREALPCLKRQLARVVFKTMLRTERATVGAVLRAEFSADSVAIAV
jgi:hypothetical protein